MSQPELVLYHFPGACSQVAVCALEQAGLKYRLELVNIHAGDQNKPTYLAINPLGKVPLLLIDRVPLTENAAILAYIAGLRSDAGVFPATEDPRLRAEAIGGMSFCGGTLHPIVRGLLNPQRLTTGDGAPVREKSTELALKSFKQAENRIAAQGWWLGEWSIVDVYLNWAFGVARKGGFDTAQFPQLEGLAARLTAVPSFARTQGIEAKGSQQLGLA